MSVSLAQRSHHQSCGCIGIMGRWVAVAAAAVVCLSAGGALGQPTCAGRWDVTPGLNGGVGGPNGAMAAAVMPSGDVVVGGYFSAAGGAPARNVALYHPATGTWSAMGAGLGVFEVKAVCALANGDVIAGGGFVIPAVGIARWNHLTNQWMPMGVLSGGFRHVRALLTMPDGSVMAAGSFTSVDGVAANIVARWNPQTSTWSGWGNAVNSSIGWGLALAPNGDVILIASGGGLYRLSAATNAWTPVSTGGVSSFNVLAVTVLPDGDIVVGGSLGPGSDYNSAPFRRNAATGVWTQMGSVQGTLGDIVSTANGEIYAMSTGGAWSVAPFTYSAMMRWNSAASAWESMQLGGWGSNGVTELGGLAVLANGDLFCAGQFTRAGGVPISNAAIWTRRPACEADFNCSTQLEVQDIFDFLGAWFAGEQTADFNGGGLSDLDIFDFLGAWFEGC